MNRRFPATLATAMLFSGNATAGHPISEVICDRAREEIGAVLFTMKYFKEFRDQVCSAKGDFETECAAVLQTWEVLQWWKLHIEEQVAKLTHCK